MVRWSTLSQSQLQNNNLSRKALALFWPPCLFPTEMPDWTGNSAELGGKSVQIAKAFIFVMIDHHYVDATFSKKKTAGQAFFLVSSQRHSKCNELYCGYLSNLDCITRYIYLEVFSYSINFNVNLQVEVNFLNLITGAHQSKFQLST